MSSVADADEAPVAGNPEPTDNHEVQTLAKTPPHERERTND